MKKRIGIGWVIGLLILTISACSRDSDIYLEKYEEDIPKTQHMEADTQEQYLQNEVGMTEVSADEAEQVCYVYICGAVMKPGVYELPADSRIFEVIEAAGGLTDEADETFVNQAELVTDGMMLRIYTKDETKELAEAGADNVKGAMEPADGRIDINTATITELMTLPGIGSAKAEAIIAYREEHGEFSCIDDLMKVPGIKEGIFQQMKEHIKVKN
ncbi:MAG: helix-hairpin-helix domain-containing protein [Lachnospiraceae bacterium]|nr:helix-hairpin-helix domain-containing protein [Lachnospiraceae bacterium]